MINRELIRLKVVQLVYSNMKNPKSSLDESIKELMRSCNDAYYMYCYLLLLIPEITDYAREMYITAQERAKTLGSKEMPSDRFVNNRLAQQINFNDSLIEFSEKKGSHHWSEAIEEIKALYKKIIESDFYEAYMAANEDSYEADRELWHKAYKKVICDNEGLENFLEEWSIYWNDDKFIVDTFVLKTINRFQEANGNSQELLKAFDNEEDQRYAEGLFRHALTHIGEYQDMIASYTHHWDIDRLPPMDIAIMICAISEMAEFDGIPITITLNEYINIAKQYTSPKSYTYINGILNRVAQTLREN